MSMIPDRGETDETPRTSDIESDGDEKIAVDEGAQARDELLPDLAESDRSDGPDDV